MSTHSACSVSKASSNNLNRQVALYSLAAAVAGVSMLALAEPAAAEVVITKKTIPIPMVPFGTPGPVKISMANNGIENFVFNLYSDPAISDRGLGAWGESGQDEVIAGGSFYPKALALPRGAKIGPSAANSFASSVLVEATETGRTGRYSRGFWGPNLKDHYLGVRFQINGKTHYGWIRLSVTMDLQQNAPFMSAKITAFAYETVPNKAILAGTAKKPTTEVQPPENINSQGGPSLGMLGRGADALQMWRREEASFLP